MLKLYCLGKTRYEYTDGHIFAPKLRRKTRALLAYLCLANRPLSREHLISLFCQNSDDPASSLRWHISRIRRNLDERVLFVDSGHIQVNTEHIWTDAKAFSQVLSRAGESGTNETLEDTLALYRGDLLADVSLPDAVDFELWLLGQRAHYLRLFEQMSLGVIQSLIQQGAYDKALALLQKLLEQNSLLEDAHYWVMWLYAQTGQRLTALQQYAVYDHLMWQEFAAKPGERITALRQHIEAQQLPDHYMSMPIGSTVSAPEPQAVFCGRESETQKLRDMWRSTCTGHGAALLIEGEAGIGKSVLVSSFTAALPDTALVMQGVCYESTISVVLAPWLPIIRQAVQVLVDQRVGLSEVMLHRLRLVLPDLLSAESEGMAGVVDHELDARLLLTTMVEVLTLVARQTPTLVVLEDCHFADEFSVQLLTLLLHRLVDIPIFIVLTQRPVEARQNPYVQTALTAWESMSSCEKLLLDPLDTKSVVQLIDHLVPTVANKPALAQALLVHTMGVSLYITEVLYACQSDPNLINELPIPPSFTKLVEQRLMSMTETQRQALEALAVFEFPATVPMLLACTTQSEEQLLHSLEHGLGQRFITEQVVEQQAYYRLAHVLLQGIILEHVSEVRKQRLHRRSVVQLEKLALVLPKAKRTELVNRLVYHAQRASDVERLMRWVPIAAQLAKEAFAYRQALALYYKLDVVLQQTPDVTLKGYVCILLEMVEVLGLLGEWKVQEGVLQRIADWHRNGLLTDVALLKTFFVEYGANQTQLGEFITAERYLMQAHSFIEKEEDDTTLAQIYHRLGLIAYSQSNWDSAEEHFIKSLVIWERIGNDIAMGKIYNNLGVTAHRKSDYDLAVSYHTKNLTIRKKYNDRHGIATALNNLGAICNVQDELKEAEQYYRQALDIRTELDDQDGIAVTMSNLGDICMQQNRFSEALAYQEQSLSLGQNIGDKAGVAISLNNLGELYLYMRDFDTAIVYLTQSLDIRRDLGAKMEMAEALMNLSFAQSIVADCLPDERFYEALEIGYSIHSSYIMFLALTLLSIRLLHQNADDMQAVQYAGLLDANKPNSGQMSLRQLLPPLLAHIDPVVLQREMERGAALDVREVVEGLLSQHRSQAGLKY